MDAVLAAQTLEPARHVDDALDVGILVVHLAQVGRHLVAVGELLALLEARVQRRIAAHYERRHRLRHFVADGVGVVEHPRRVAHCGPRLDRGERDDLRHTVGAVLRCRVLDHVAAVTRVEVHVDVGHLLATRVEEALEQQVVADRVDVDDAQAVRDARTRRAPPARTHPDLLRAGEAHEVPDHQEVGGEAHALDHVELVLDALEHVQRGALAVTRLGPFEHELAEIAVLVVTLRHGERRQHRVVELDIDVGALGDPERVVARFGELGEQRPHLGGRLDVELLAVELEAVRVALQRAGLHAQQGVVRVGVVLFGVVRVVGGEQRRAEPLRDVEQRTNRRLLLVDAVVLQLHEEVIAAEDVLEAAGRLVGGIEFAGEQELAHETAETAGGGDDALVMALEEIPVGARLVVVAVEVRLARDLHQVVVADVVLGEHREVVDLVLGTPRPVEP